MSSNSYVIVNGQPADQFVMVPNHFIRCPHIEVGPKALLALMVSRGTGWTVWLDQLAGDLGTTRKAVSRWIDKAHKTPYLDVAGTGERNRWGHPTYVYHVDLTKPCKQCTAAVAAGKEQDTELSTGQNDPWTTGQNDPSKKTKLRKPSSLSPSKQASRASDPHPLPSNWRPNHTHKITAQGLGIDIEAAVDEFNISDPVADRERRSNWDRTFGEFLKLYADGRHEDVF